LGFEYGFSLENENALVLWEAQVEFSLFQIIVIDFDSFISVLNCDSERRKVRKQEAYCFNRSITIWVIDVRISDDC